jgi:hypothetical protein
MDCLIDSQSGQVAPLEIVKNELTIVAHINDAVLCRLEVGYLDLGTQDTQRLRQEVLGDEEAIDQTDGQGSETSTPGLDGWSSRLICAPILVSMAASLPPSSASLTSSNSYFQ